MILATLVLSVLLRPALVALVPLDAVSAADIAIASESLKTGFGVQIRVLPRRGSIAFSGRTPNVSADALVLELDKLLPTDCDRIIGVTSRDLVAGSGTGKEDVFGLSEVSGKGLIISTYRCGRPGSPSYVRTLSNVARHEMGHAFGLKHCPVPGCLMNDSRGTTEGLGRKLLGLCPACTEEIRTFSKSGH